MLICCSAFVSHQRVVYLAYGCSNELVQPRCCMLYTTDSCVLCVLYMLLHAVHAAPACRDVSENKIQTIPAFIGQLSSLTRLDLHTNLMQELPPQIGNLKKVKHL